MTPLIKADHVSVLAGSYVLLQPVSFTVGTGVALAITGSNGSGKTTLLRVLAALTSPSTGAVAIAGEVPDDRNRTFRARVAALIGLPPLARNLTLREHMMLVATSWGSTISEAADTADRLLEELRITGLHDRYPHELSSGQTQLFALALTLSRRFDVLLLDEPEQRLDPDRLELVAGVLRGLADAGKTLVLASHSKFLIEHVSDRQLPLTQAAYVNHP
ncbi:putative ABC-type multidrug transport system, ATPase component [Arthrobacter sp. PAMC 25486]|uniref:ABC transporter ATP-binding protein n=1 Tax=Arthrobacter sp. PAMC 25486 TaxID=1494608 RepID=UPI000535EEA5|nr:ABC transporter ATP-binding protein [Arthrobacter sp. PAMC 25486]AIY00164.1 putative ABC-type multidrug transport system, ATPase component [Arthrobacter sp. PAMC 25486]